MIRTETILGSAVLRIVLDAPKANVIDAAMIAAIERAYDELIDQHTKLVVFEGAGEHFCFGASVPEHQRQQAPAMLARFHALFRKMAGVAVPTCAVVRGQCLGGGLELAAWCSFVVCTPDARLGQPEIRLAVIAPMASVLLPWRVGGQVAMDLCLSGRSVHAKEALQMGLINAVAEDAEAWWRAWFDEHLRPRSATALRFAERAVRRDLLRRMHVDLPWIERMYVEELMATRDANEGVAAFMERRAPEFNDT